MDRWMWISALGIIAIIVYRYGCHWWKTQQTSKQADKLLAHIIKAKDSYRR